MTWGSSPSLARHLSAVVTAQQPWVMQSLFLKRWKIMRRHSICLYTCFQDATHLKAIVVKAESLYSTCQVWYIMPPPHTHTPSVQVWACVGSLSTRDSACSWLNHHGDGHHQVQESHPQQGSRTVSFQMANGHFFLSLLPTGLRKRRLFLSWIKKFHWFPARRWRGFQVLLNGGGCEERLPWFCHQVGITSDFIFIHHINIICNIVMACKELHWPGLHHQMLSTRFFVILFLQG